MKKRLMVTLALFFVLLLAAVFILAKNKKIPQTATQVPQESITPTAAGQPTPAPTGIVYEIENELNLIESDLKKVKEDSRLEPPSFNFTLGLSQP